MKRSGKKSFLILWIFYPISLLLGMATMLAFSYYSHPDELISIAQEAADRYLEEGSLSVEASYGMAILACDLEGNCLDKLTSGVQATVYGVHVEDYLALIEKKGTALFYDRITISIPEGSRKQLSLIAVAPLTEDGAITGCIVLIRDLDNFSYFALAYTIVLTLFFGFLSLFLRIQGKMKARFDQMQRNYIAAMNHELKSPIASIKALAETLLDGYGTSPEKQLLYHSTILKEAQRLEDTVCEILELSKLQNTKEMYRKQQATVEEVFGPVLTRYTSLCEDIDLRFEAPDLCAEELPPLFTAPKLITRVLDLLLHNATKFTEAESGEIAVEFAAKKDHLEVCVRDNGRGISQEALPHIFERFYHSEDAWNKTGSGLGLSIVREILDGLQEEISVDSTLGSGTAFTFTVGTKA